MGGITFVVEPRSFAARNPRGSRLLEYRAAKLRGSETPTNRGSWKTEPRRFAALPQKQNAPAMLQGRFVLIRIADLIFITLS